MKKIICVLTLIMTVLGGGINIFAATQDQYQMVWKELNAKYGMDLPLDYVNKDEISLDQFKVKAEEFIKHERDTENYIKERIDDNIMESDVLNLSLNTRSTKSVTYKKDCKGLGQYFKIKATYTINGKKIVKAKRSSIIYKTAANVANVYLTNIGKAQYSYLDSMRTLAVKYQAKVHFDSAFGSTGTLYAEFNYNG